MNSMGNKVQTSQSSEKKLLKSKSLSKDLITSNIYKHTKGNTKNLYQTPCLKEMNKTIPNRENCGIQNSRHYNVSFSKETQLKKNPRDYITLIRKINV